MLACLQGLGREARGARLSLALDDKAVVFLAMASPRVATTGSTDDPLYFADRSRYPSR